MVGGRAVCPGLADCVEETIGEVDKVEGVGVVDEGGAVETDAPGTGSSVNKLDSSPANKSVEPGCCSFTTDMKAWQPTARFNIVVLTTRDFPSAKRNPGIIIEIGVVIFTAVMPSPFTPTTGAVGGMDAGLCIASGLGFSWIFPALGSSRLASSSATSSVSATKVPALGEGEGACSSDSILFLYRQTPASGLNLFQTRRTSTLQQKPSILKL